MTALEVPAWSWPHLLELRRQGKRTPLVFIPGLRGTPLRFRMLVELFGAEQPLWAMQLLGEHEEEPVADYSVEEIAAVFEPQLSAAIPTGPIVLGGFSMGAIIAFELARRLTRRGREVPLLVSLDGDAPQYRNRRVPWQARLRAHATSLRARPRSYAHDRARNWRRQLLAWLGVDWPLAPDLRELDRDARARRKQLALCRERAAMRYRPQEALRTGLLLIRGSDSELPLGAVDHPSYGWTDYIDGPIDIVSCEGNHQTVMESDENRRLIVDAITASVSRVATASPKLG